MLITYCFLGDKMIKCNKIHQVVDLFNQGEGNAKILENS